MSAIIDYIVNFEWRDGGMPLSTWREPIIAVTAYAIIIPLIQFYMKGKKPYELRTFAIYHNLFLCVFSLLFVIGTTYEMIKIAYNDGVYGLFCDREKKYHRGPGMFYLYIFYVSKYWELLDTVILALKKKDLIFLHVYHHPATLVLCFFGMREHFPPQWFTCTANGTVHVFMYYYYYSAILKRAPWWKKYITQLQIIQFALDIATSYIWVYYTIVDGEPCAPNWKVFLTCQIIIYSYLVLFIIFYIKEYFSEKQNKATTSDTKQNSNGKVDGTDPKKDQ